MSPKTPQKPDDNLHGEEDKKPLFGINENPSGVYDERHKTPAGDPSDPRGDYEPQTTPLGDPSDPRGKKSLSSDEISSKEAAAGSAADKDTGTETEKESLGIGKSSSQAGEFGYREENPSSFSWTRFRGRFTRRRVAGIAAAGILGVGGIGILSIVQGPLQFIHLAQNLQKFHLRSNEEFGNDRSSKVLLYAIGGLGAERGRLGITSNKFADKWEQRLVDSSGLRPVYNKTTGRFAGFEIVDREKARSIIEQWEKDGGKITKVGEAGGQGVRSTKAKNGQIDNNSDFLDARGDNARAKRNLITFVSKSTGTNNIAGTLGARLLKKRGGVDFAPLKNKKRDFADNRADRRADKKAIQREAAERNRVGLDPVQQGLVRSTQDPDGREITDPQAPKVAEDGKAAIDEATEKLNDIPDGETPSSVRLSIVRAAGAVGAV